MKSTLVNALLAAGEIQLKNFQQLTKVTQKESISSIVTNVDLLCDQCIFDILSVDFPDYSLLSEERDFVDNGSEFTWVVDPLDGTSNYAAGLPWYGILIALFKGNEPIMGGAYLPASKQMYLAERGNGTFLNDRQLYLQDSALRNSLFAFSTNYTDDYIYQQAGLKLYSCLLGRVRNIRSTNSLLDYLLVAEGKLGGAVNLFSKIWDIAAPSLIIEEAGGMMKLVNNDPLEFDFGKKAFHKNYPVITGSPSIIHELSDLLL